MKKIHKLVLKAYVGPLLADSLATDGFHQAGFARRMYGDKFCRQYPIASMP